MQKRIIVVLLSLAAGCGIAVGCGPEEDGFRLVPGGPDTGGLNPPQIDGSAESGADAPIEASGDAQGDASDAGSCASCPPRTVCVENACAAARRVFVSSTASTANLGGSAGADARCQNLANGKNFGGTWRAWISDDDTSPADRFVKSTVPYRLLDGALVANNWSDLTDGTLAHGIDRDENGVFADTIEVWTGTANNGGSLGNQCNDFTSGTTGANAMMGITTPPKSWTAEYPQFCDRTNGRIYCFEQ